jgi:hypothetical protein
VSCFFFLRKGLKSLSEGYHCLGEIFLQMLLRYLFSGYGVYGTFPKDPELSAGIIVPDTDTGYMSGISFVQITRENIIQHCWNF